jgi:polyisoprenyl-phosphate glycosyltransferase
LDERSSSFLLSIIIPCYNEEDVIEMTYDRLVEVFGQDPSLKLEIIFVDDGSRDQTYSILKSKFSNDKRIRLVKLSRNFGHQMAVTAGLNFASGDVVAVIDADLQDPPEVIVEMIDDWRNGYDVVYGVRAKRKESLFFKSAYKIYYRLLKSISSIDIPLDSGDFCIMDRRVVDHINELPEKNRYIRGLRAWLGFNQKGLVYERDARAAGSSKYSLFSLFKLAMDGIINFSIFPLTLITLLGFLTSFIAVLGSIFYLIMWLTDFVLFGLTVKDVPGFTTIILAILFFSGVQLFSIGIIGQYIGRMYIEIKDRPAYIASEVLGFEEI